MKANISVLVLAGLALGGCVSLPERAPRAPTLAAWTAPAQTTQPVALDWWTGFHDPALDAAVDKALARNADLRAASANLKAAQAVLGEAKTYRLPSGEVAAGVARGRVAALSQPPFEGAPARYPTQTLANVGASLGWEVDLFGRLAANVDATRAQTAEALWLRRQTEAAVAAAVVRAYVEHRYASEAEALVQRRVDLLDTMRISVEKAEGLGAASRIDREAAQAALAQARAQLPDLTATRRNAARRLAVLCGEAPSPELAAGRLPTAPSTLLAGDPAAMLRRRPDVAAAEQRLTAASAAARIAVADLYPRVTLSGNIGLSAEPDQLDKAGALGFGVGPRLSWGLFDMPRLRQRVAAADARSEAALAQWEAAALFALQEADSALETWGQSREASRQTERAAQAADRGLDLAARREAAGQIAQRVRLQAEGEALGARAAALQARSQETQAWIAAQLALGAGWRDAALDPAQKRLAEAVR